MAESIADISLRGIWSGRQRYFRLFCG